MLNKPKPSQYVMFYSPTVVVKVSVLLPGLWKTQNSMFSSTLTAGVDNIFQTGVFVMKVRSTWSKVSQHMRAVWQRAQNTQHSTEKQSKMHLKTNPLSQRQIVWMETAAFFSPCIEFSSIIFFSQLYSGWPKSILRISILSTGFLSEAVLPLTVCILMTSLWFAVFL